MRVRLPLPQVPTQSLQAFHGPIRQSTTQACSLQGVSRVRGPHASTASGQDEHVTVRVSRTCPPAHGLEQVPAGVHAPTVQPGDVSHGAVLHTCRSTSSPHGTADAPMAGELTPRVRVWNPPPH